MLVSSIVSFAKDIFKKFFLLGVGGGGGIKTGNCSVRNHMFFHFRHDAGIKPKSNSKNTNVSTPAWMSPELLNKGEITTKSDVYSFAVILWEMLTRKEPYSNLSVFQVSYSKLPVFDVSVLQVSYCKTSCF